ncbi:MAG TPA: DUF4917 family protein [Acidimicrobiales bacterium]|nr:DUF4917 family protein [Acidimicrobiales bacterium]
MTAAPLFVDATLEAWEAVRDDGPWPALLLGNGASRAVWAPFAYDSLFEYARLSSADRELFDVLHTRNFELVLEGLRFARLVYVQDGLDASQVDRRYESVQQALARAVCDTHVARGAIPDSRLQVIGEALLCHEAVYQTSYDLLTYWALLTAAPGAFVDYFWNEQGGRLAFDPANAKPPRRTAVLYLHGGLHLYRLADGTTCKRRWSRGANVLDMFGKDPAESPVFVSEGTSAEKLRAIDASVYLSFVNRLFREDSRPLVVFGHSLGEQDAHIAAAIGRHADRRVAISVMPDDEAAVVKRKAELLHLLPSCRLRFFDATTHPLGKAELQLHPWA